MPRNSLAPYSNCGGIIPQFVLGLLGGVCTGLTSPLPRPPRDFFFFSNFIVWWLVSKKKCPKKYKLPALYSPDTGSSELLLVPLASDSR